MPQASNPWEANPLQMVQSIPLTAQLVVGLLTAALVYVSIRHYAGRRRLPPGPPGIPIIGNLHEAPSTHPWRTLADWHKKYGPVYSVQFGWQTFIMLGTHEDAEALLDKRGAIYSSRPPLPMVNDCVSKNRRIVFLQYGEQFQQQRRLMNGFLKKPLSDSYRDFQDVESLQLMTELLEPTHFLPKFHRFSASLGLGLAYGKRMPTGKEPEVVMSEHIIDQMNDVFLARWIVDAIPALNVLPTWLAPWKRYAEKLSKEEADFFNSMRDKGEAEESWNWTKQVKSMVGSEKLDPTERSFIVNAAYEAGVDTQSIALQVGVLAALMAPDKMRKAQKELDSVVGRERLPDFSDIDDLPYIQAFIKEIHRWRPAIPGGIPHMTTQDDYYKGYFIPKGTAVQGNHWAISMNPDVYEKPSDFNPDRWIEHPDLPSHVTFGFGRRGCMGRHIVHNTMFIAYARIFWAFDVEHAYEERDGKRVRCEVDPLAFTNTFNSSPLPFQAEFKARDQRVADIIGRAWQGAEKDGGALLRGIRAKHGEDSTTKG